MTLTGDATASIQTDAAGNYLLSSLPAGGNYVVTPTKADLLPASAGINTVDVIAIQRHFLSITLLTGCRLTAGDANGDANITTTDVIATQRFLLGFATGTANVGKFRFMPANTSYSAITADQVNQNYNSLIIGDVATPFASRGNRGSNAKR
jgi:hypothetical protein